MFHTNPFLLKTFDVKICEHKFSNFVFFFYRNIYQIKSKYANYSYWIYLHCYSSHQCKKKNYYVLLQISKISLSVMAIVWNLLSDKTVPHSSLKNFKIHFWNEEIKIKHLSKSNLKMLLKFCNKEYARDSGINRFS